MGGGQRAVRLLERNRVVAALAEYLDRGSVGDGGLTAINGHHTAVHEKLSSRVATSRDSAIDAVAYFETRPAVPVRLESRWILFGNFLKIF